MPSRSKKRKAGAKNSSQDTPLITKGEQDFMRLGSEQYLQSFQEQDQELQNDESRDQACSVHDEWVNISHQDVGFFIFPGSKTVRLNENYFSVPPPISLASPEIPPHNIVSARQQEIGNPTMSISEIAISERERYDSKGYEFLEQLGDAVEDHGCTEESVYSLSSECESNAGVAEEAGAHLEEVLTMPCERCDDDNGTLSNDHRVDHDHESSLGAVSVEEKFNAFASELLTTTPIDSSEAAKLVQDPCVQPAVIETESEKLVDMNPGSLHEHESDGEIASSIDERVANINALTCNFIDQGPLVASASGSSDDLASNNELLDKATAVEESSPRGRGRPFREHEQPNLINSEYPFQTEGTDETLSKNPPDVTESDDETPYTDVECAKEMDDRPDRAFMQDMPQLHVESMLELIIYEETVQAVPKDKAIAIDSSQLNVETTLALYEETVQAVPADMAIADPQSLQPINDTQDTAKAICTKDVCRYSTHDTGSQDSCYKLCELYMEGMTSCSREFVAEQMFVDTLGLVEDVCGTVAVLKEDNIQKYSSYDNEGEGSCEHSDGPYTEGAMDLSSECAAASKDEDFQHADMLPNSKELQVFCPDEIPPSSLPVIVVASDQNVLRDSRNDTEHQDSCENRSGPYSLHPPAVSEDQNLACSNIIVPAVEDLLQGEDLHVICDKSFHEESCNSISERAAVQREASLGCLTDREEAACTEIRTTSPVLINQEEIQADLSFDAYCQATHENPCKVYDIKSISSSECAAVPKEQSLKPVQVICTDKVQATDQAAVATVRENNFHLTRRSLEQMNQQDVDRKQEAAPGHDNCRRSWWECCGIFELLLQST